MKNILYKSLAVLAAGLLLGACDENAIEDHNDPVTAGAFLKFAHAAPLAPMVNFYLDSEKISAVAPTSEGAEQGIGFTGTSLFPASYGYANVEAGSHNLQALEAGTAQPVANSSVTLAEGEHYTAFLLGEAGAFETFVVEDNLPEPGYAQSYIRFVNVVPDAPMAFDVKAVRKATTETAEKVTTIGTGVEFKSSSPYVAIDAQGSYNFVISPAGESTTYMTVTNVSPTAGRVYTVYVRGNYGTDTDGAILFRDR